MDPGRLGGGNGVAALGETADVDFAAPSVEADVAAAAALEKAAVGRSDPDFAPLRIGQSPTRGGVRRG